jgi:hypothetical protein
VQAWCSGENCLTDSPGRRFEAASPHLPGKACLGLSLPQTPLMWEFPALGLPFFSLVFCILIFQVVMCFYHQVMKSMNSISGDANNIQIGSGTNIQDNSLVHVAKSNLSGKVFPTIIGNNVTIGKCLKKYDFL